MRLRMIVIPNKLKVRTNSDATQRTPTRTKDRKRVVKRVATKKERFLFEITLGTKSMHYTWWWRLRVAATLRSMHVPVFAHGIWLVCVRTTYERIWIVCLLHFVRWIMPLKQTLWTHKTFILRLYPKSLLLLWTHCYRMHIVCTYKLFQPHISYAFSLKRAHTHILFESNAFMRK